MVILYSNKLHNSYMEVIMKKLVSLFAALVCVFTFSIGNVSAASVYVNLTYNEFTDYSSWLSLDAGETLHIMVENHNDFNIEYAVIDNLGRTVTSGEMTSSGLRSYPRDLPVGKYKIQLNCTSFGGFCNATGTLKDY